MKNTYYLLLSKSKKAGRNTVRGNSGKPSGVPKGIGQRIEHVFVVLPVLSIVPDPFRKLHKLSGLSGSYPRPPIKAVIQRGLRLPSRRLHQGLGLQFRQSHGRPRPAILAITQGPRTPIKVVTPGPMPIRPIQ
jgi:hypothetical protein